MTPYAESGTAAQKSLERSHRREMAGGEERCLKSLRGFKQIINLLGVAAIILVPVTGVMSGSAVLALIVAFYFFGIIVMLEVMERRVKSDLAALRREAPTSADA